jgi:hypothetical protein
LSGAGCAAGPRSIALGPTPPPWPLKGTQTRDPTSSSKIVLMDKSAQHAARSNVGMKGALIPLVALTRGFALVRSAGPEPETVPMMADGSLLRSGGETGGRCRLRMFRKQVTRPVDSLDPPSWPRKRSRSSELEERPGHAPDPRSLCLQSSSCWALGDPARCPETRQNGVGSADVVYERVTEGR